MKCQALFSRTIKKIINILSSAEFVHIVVNFEQGKKK